MRTVILWTAFFILAAGAVFAGEEEFTPKAYRPVFSEAEREQPHVQARSHHLRHWPFLDGQWLGIVNDPDGYTWFSFSTHSGTEHAQVFRYDHINDRVNHIADLGQACGETLTGNPPQDKIHGAMFVEGSYVLAGTCEGHAIAGNPYRGGYWLKIDRKTGETVNLGMSISKDGLLCVGYDPVNKRLYGHTNRKGWLTMLDLNTGKEEFCGVPWQDVIDAWKADTSPNKPREIWPRGLTLMITADGKVYGAKPPGVTFWVYDPDTDEISNLEVDVPLPEEVAAGDERAVERWKRSALHYTMWDEEDKCFYVIRSYDEMLCRFLPPDGERPAKFETIHPMGLSNHRYSNRYASCMFAMHDRVVYYTPYTGWGGTANLQSYDLRTGKFTDHGPIVVEGGRRVNECHSMTATPDGKLHLAAFVYSKEGTRDPVTPWAMRDVYPFHSRLVIIDPETDLITGE